MGKDTPISWTDHTFNPWWGCTRVSPACGMPLPGHENEEHGVCYAEMLSNRWGFEIWGQDVGRRTFSAGHWADPLEWNRQAEREGKRKLVFCGSMCDVMEDRRELDAERAKLWPLIKATPWLIWMLTTKRPQNFPRLLPPEWVANPPANVWAIVTVETQEYVWRIESMMAIPFAVFGVSCEPLLGEIELPFRFISCPRAWVIGGGESGHGARPTHPEWARKLRDDAAHYLTPFHWKQWGEWLPAMQEGAALEGRPQPLNCSDGPERVGKKAAGHLLDGREHLEFPEACHV